MSANPNYAPSSANRMAMASPIPAPTPVMMAILSFSRIGIRSNLRNRNRRKLPAADDTVDHAVLQRLLGAHDVVAIHVAGYSIDGLPGRIGQQLVQRLAHSQDLTGINIDFRGLAGQALHRRLVDHDAGVG